MSEEIENKLNKIPVVKQMVAITKAIKLKTLEEKFNPFVSI